MFMLKRPSCNSKVTLEKSLIGLVETGVCNCCLQVMWSLVVGANHPSVQGNWIALELFFSPRVEPKEGEWFGDVPGIIKERLRAQPSFAMLGEGAGGDFCVLTFSILGAMGLGEASKKDVRIH